MEANREDALTCLRRAREALRSGDLEKAKKLANKSKGLFPMKDTEDFLQQIDFLLTSSTTNTTIPNGHESHSSTARSRTKPAAASSSSESKSESSEDPKYTMEQKKAVDEILKCKDYYKILGVSKDVNENDLKKSYKKLALQFHPDKNNAPRADEAFKAISKAYNILSDTEKRERYDRFGEEGLNPQNLNHGHFYRTNFEFDLFRQMFGDNPFDDEGTVFYQFGPGGTYYTVRRRPHYHHHHYHHPQVGMQRGSPFFLLLFIVPLLVITLSFLFAPTIPYSLYRTRSYPVKRVTKQHSITYYVKNSFETDYPQKDQRAAIEDMVIRDYIDKLRDQCAQEVWFRANKKKLPRSCERLETITGKKLNFKR